VNAHCCTQNHWRLEIELPRLRPHLRHFRCHFPLAVHDCYTQPRFHCCHAPVAVLDYMMFICNLAVGPTCCSPGSPCSLTLSLSLSLSLIHQRQDRPSCHSTIAAAAPSAAGACPPSPRAAPRHTQLLLPLPPQSPAAVLLGLAAAAATAAAAASAQLLPLSKLLLHLVPHGELSLLLLLPRITALL
jgi:hypothetical protein